MKEGHSKMPAQVSSVRHLHDYVLELRFSDGSNGLVDFRDRIVGRGGVFAVLEEIEMFRQVRVDPEAGTIAWPNGVDFCPDVLHHEATGAPLPRLPAGHRAA
jgi:hypothetical protein